MLRPLIKINFASYYSRYLFLVNNNPRLNSVQITFSLRLEKSFYSHVIISQLC